MRSRSLLLLVATLLVASGGCATVVSSPNAKVALRSEPAGARVTVRNDAGDVVAQSVTPAEVSLKRSGKWARPAKYVATFETPGHTPTAAPIRMKPNPWLLGNIIAGGPLGLAVDAATGAMYRPQHAEIAPVLARAGMPSGAAAVRVANVTEAKTVR
ncbi:MAG: hypothetical protein AAFV43_03020 [Planctomycetota bacterium]